jgi:hypothetical protein
LFGNISTNWKPVGTGEFDGNGKNDLISRNNSGNTAVSFMNGITVSLAAGVPLNRPSRGEAGSFTESGHDRPNAAQRR